ncbi:myotubularin-related 13-like, partial [Brachionus plicatilis]
EHEHEHEQSGETAYKFIGKFVDRVCSEGGLNEEQKSSLHQNLCDVIRMQIETMEAVCAHSKLVPLRHKPKMEQLRPDWLLHGEQMLEPGPLRSYLVPDGRTHRLVPAEGALFLTNYRLIYRGIALNDPDLVVTRSFPVAALLKDKRLVASYTPVNLATNVLVNGVQIRSSTFELCNIYFDECVCAELVDKFRSTLAKCKCPASVYDVFSVTKSVMVMGKKHEVNAVRGDTFRTFAKSTLRKAGLMPTKGGKTASAANRTPETGRKATVVKSVERETSEPDDSLDSLSVVEESVDAAHVLKMVECSLAYCDYVRQGLVSEQTTAELRICTMNAAYQLAKSLPCLFLVPRHTSDECVRKNAKCHRQNRLPVLVWKHPRLNSVVLRGSAFHAKGFLGALIKTSSSSANAAAHNLEVKDSHINNSSMDQDKYLNEILRLTSLEHEANVYPCTPLTHRRSLFASKFDKAVKTIKNNYAFASSQQNANPVTHAASHTTHFTNSKK